MRLLIQLASLLLLLSLASTPAAADESIRVLSWNISGDAFVSEPQAFRSVLRWADPDVILLDEVEPSADREKLVDALAGVRPGYSRAWNIDIGASGGRQRGLIASRAKLETLPEFTSIVPYPKGDERHLLDRMSPEESQYPNWSMEGGIPVNGALIHTGERRLLVVIADLQCCGDDPDSWQEYRRRVEAKEIRRLIRQVLNRSPVDGVVFAGDFNMVNSTFPMTILGGPLPPPHSGLIPAEVYHADGVSSWTWDGRGMPFPSNTLDYQLYAPHGLTMQSGDILDSEAVSAELREQLGLEFNTSMRLGRHRPIVVEYTWVEQD